jgi:RsiW-degrading membrane proteinase PrsW (M82 family)
MLNLRQRRGFLLIALIAIGVALVLLMAPQANGPGHAPFLAIIPLLFLGIISLLSLLSPLLFLYTGRTPDSPTLPAVFQRPPPFRLA